MRLNVSAWSIRRPIPAIILFIILSILGIIAFRALPVERFPNIDFPLISVTVTQAGASPSELETQVTRRVEDAVSSVVGVKHITSVLTDGSLRHAPSNSSLRPTPTARSTTSRTPSPASAPICRAPSTSRSFRASTSTTMPIVTYAVSAPQMTLEELSWFIDDKVNARVAGRARRGADLAHRRRGPRDPHVARPVPAAGARHHGGRCERTAARHQTSTSPAGAAKSAAPSRPSARWAARCTVERLAATSITLPGGRKVRLDELGTVTDSYEEPRTFAAPERQAHRRASAFCAPRAPAIWRWRPGCG